MNTCSIADCADPHYAHGLCKRHGAQVFSPGRDSRADRHATGGERHGGRVQEPRTAVVRAGVPHCPACDGTVIRGDDGPLCLGCAWSYWEAAS